MGDLIPISEAPSYDDGGVPPGPGTIVDTEGRELKARRPAPEGYQRGEDMIEHRVRLTREEFRKVATGQYPVGEQPEHGAPTVTVVDKRGRNNVAAAARRAEEEARAKQRQAQAHWTQQAAGTMFWEAQRVGAVDPAMAEAILAKRGELVAGAKKKGILV